MIINNAASFIFKSYSKEQFLFRVWSRSELNTTSS